MNPEIEAQDLFPEEEGEQNENGEPEETEGINNDEMGEEDGEREKGEEEGDNETEKEESDENDNEKKGDIQRMTEEGDKEEKTEGEDEGDGEKAIPSNDKEATEEAQSADMETMEASKDKTKVFILF